MASQGMLPIKPQEAHNIRDALKYNKPMRHIPLLLITLLAIGCGGGGAGTTSTTGDQSGVFGPFQTRATGGKPQVVTTTTGPTITGIAGAAFTKITYAPTANLANSRLAFTRQSLGGSALYIANNDGSNPHPISGVYPSDSYSWSRDGRIVFDQMDYTIFHHQIYVVNSDGSNLHKISTGGFDDFNPAWAPDNLHIAFQRIDATGNFQIYSMTASGGSVLRLGDGVNVSHSPAWTPDSSKVLYLQSDTVRDNVWRVNANGTSPVQITSGYNIYSFALSPNNSRMVLSYVPTSTVAMVTYDYPSMSTIGTLQEQPGTSFYVKGWSADSNKILYMNIGSNSELDSCTVDGHNQTTVAGFGDGSVVTGAWEPSPLPIPYVASTGGYTVNNASSGFIYALAGKALASFVNFTATTPTSTTLTVDPVMNPSSDVVYHIHADAITSLKFVNGFGGGLNTVTVPAGTKEALVSFDGVDGSVVSVLSVSSKKNPTLLYKAKSH